MSPKEWYGLFTPANIAYLNVFFIILIVWSLIWKGIALWKAARAEDKVWYILLLIINTLGLLEILYIFVFSRREMTPVKDESLDSARDKEKEDKKEA
jgi:hypothetical protein